MKRSLGRALALHDSAVETLIQTAESVPELRWNEPVREGKWTPGTVVEHLNRTYDTLLEELAGGAGMKIRTPFFGRLALRLTVLPRILIFGKFPAGAPAPRETRPAESESVDREATITSFRERAALFVEAVRTARPGQKITHAYFGSASIASGVVLCARHIQHHSAQLPSTRD